MAIILSSLSNEYVQYIRIATINEDRTSTNDLLGLPSLLLIPR
jgi:hypothetical protein